MQAAFYWSQRQLRVQLDVSVGMKKSAASGAGDVASQFIPRFQLTDDIHCVNGFLSWVLFYSNSIISLQGKT